MDEGKAQWGERGMGSDHLVVTVRPGARAEVRRLLLDLGSVSDTPHDNVLVLHVRDPLAALRMLQLWYRINPDLRHGIDHAVPVTRAFGFAGRDDFARRASEAVRAWLPLLAGKSVHVHRDRHGVRPEAGCRARARELRRIVADEARRAGVATREGSEDADVTIALACIDHWAGLSLWTRRQRLRYPELGFASASHAA